MPSSFLAEIEVLGPKKYQEYVDRASEIVLNYPRASAVLCCWA